MPEIVEIRKYADLIRTKLKNKQISNIKILKGRYKTKNKIENFNKIKSKLPIKVLNVKTKGKLIYIHLENDLYLLNKAGLMGGWCWKNKNSDKYTFSKNTEYYSKFAPKDKINSYTKNSLNHLNIEFITNKGSLYYHDVLSYGTIKCVEGTDELDRILDKIGSDIMEETTDFNTFKTQITKQKNLNKYIANVLLDQSVISGFGNYLRAEIL